MNPDYFYINNHMTVPLEHFLKSCETYEDFEKRFSDELLNEDGRIGMYLSSLLNKYDQKASVVSFDAHLNPSYVGNIINGKKNNPSRDALICICYALGYCLKNPATRHQWREPLSLRLSDGRVFPLEFDCRHCQMNVYAK